MYLARYRVNPQCSCAACNILRGRYDEVDLAIIIYSNALYRAHLSVERQGLWMLLEVYPGHDDSSALALYQPNPQEPNPLMYLARYRINPQCSCPACNILRGRYDEVDLAIIIYSNALYEAHLRRLEASLGTPLHRSDASR